MMTRLLVAAAAALLMTGCTTSVQYVSDPDLLGTWDDNGLALTFHDDGTLTSIRTIGTVGTAGSGTWTVDGDLLRFRLDEPASDPTRTLRTESASTYHAGPGALELPALWPVGAHHGVVGTWKGREAFSFDPQGVADGFVDTTLALRADHGCTRTTSNGGAQPCTWSQDTSGGVILDIDHALPPLRLVDDQVLSTKVIPRLR